MGGVGEKRSVDDAEEPALSTRAQPNQSAQSAQRSDAPVANLGLDGALLGG